MSSGTVAMRKHNAKDKQRSRPPVQTWIIRSHRILHQISHQIPHQVTISAFLLSIATGSPVKAVPPETRPKTVTVQRFEIVGSTVFQPWELENVTQPFEAQTLPIEGLQKAADAITHYYADHGYLTSRAVLGDQTIEGGVVQIRVIEGSLAKLTIEGTKDVSDHYLSRRITLAGLAPFNQERLEYELRLLRSDPLFANVEATVKEGSEVGKSLLHLVVKEAPNVQGSATLDNYGSRTVGRQQLGLTAGIGNFAGFGDSLSLSQVRSGTGGIQAWQLGYQLPLNAKQGSLNLRFGHTGYQVTQPELRDLDITGRAMIYEASLRQPILRSLKNEAALSLGVIHRSGNAVVGNVLTNSNSSTIVRFGQDWLRREVGGYWIGSSQVDIGQSAGDGRGRFLVWSGALQRIHTLSKSHTLIASAHWQFTPDRLPGSQEFSVGGSQMLRGFPGGVLSGDSGFTVSLEDRITVMRRASGLALLQISPYLETGRVWSQPGVGRSNAIGLLWSAGVGINWNPMPSWGMRLDAAMPIAGGGKGLGDLSFYLSSSYRF